jgi:hypothetical protein
MQKRNRVTHINSKRLGFKIEKNIEPLVYFLNSNGVRTSQSCGHEGFVNIVSRKYLSKARNAMRKLSLPVRAKVSVTSAQDWEGKRFSVIYLNPAYIPIATKTIEKKYPEIAQSQEKIKGVYDYGHKNSGNIDVVNDIDNARNFIRAQMADININGKGYQGSIIKDIYKTKIFTEEERKKWIARVLAIKPFSAFSDK